MKLEAGRLRLPASDVANFLACGHLTRLDMLSAQGKLRPPREFNAGFQDPVARGEAHEPLPVRPVSASTGSDGAAEPPVTRLILTTGAFFVKGFGVVEG